MQIQNTTDEVRKANIKSLERVWSEQPEGHGYIQAVRHDGRSHVAYIRNDDGKHLRAFCDKYRDYSIHASPLTFKKDDEFGHPFRAIENMLPSNFVWGTHCTPQYDGTPLDDISGIFIWRYNLTPGGADADIVLMFLNSLGGPTKVYVKEDVLKLFPISLYEPTWKKLASQYRVAIPMKAPPRDGDRSAAIMWITGLMLERGASAHEIVKVLPHAKPFIMKYGDKPRAGEQELQRIFDKVRCGEFSKERA